MASKKTKASSRLSLPWERGDSVLYAVLSGRRIWPLFVAMAFGLVLLAAYYVETRRSDLRSTRATLYEVQRATHAFVRGIGRCPHSAEELIHPPKSGMRYLAFAPVDAWGRGLRLRCSTGAQTAVEVMSAGPSGSFLTDDNVM
jgi:hypothetical protein